MSEKVEEESFTVASRFRFLEVGEVGALCLSFVAGNEAVMAEGTSVDASFFGFVDMDDASFLVASRGV